MSDLPYWSMVEKEGYIGAQTHWVDIGEGVRAFLGIPESGSKVRGRFRERLRLQQERPLRAGWVA